MELRHSNILRQTKPASLASPLNLHRNTFTSQIQRIRPNLYTMASKQHGPHIPSDEIASKLEKPKGQPKTMKKEHVDAKPGPVILSEEQAAKVDPPMTKEELQKKAKEMNE